MDAAFVAAVVAVVRALQPGEVAAYGEVAQEAGYPGRARAVGRVLATWQGEDERPASPRADARTGGRGGQRDALPWWRVIGAGGRLRAPSAAVQEARLRAEGVTIIDGRVRL